VESGILLEKGKLSPWHYKNIIKLALRLQKFDWTEQFILQNTRLLDDVHRDDAYYYNLAELYYYTGRFDAAMSFLNKVDFSDIHYNLGAKVLLVKIYYETDTSDALESLLHSFKTYLQRNKVISEELRRTYLNFIQMVAQMIRATPAQFAALRQKVEQQPLLTDKNWLLQRLS
jgi:tetratricopeptide (TPR) repeat protein